MNTLLKVFSFAIIALSSTHALAQQHNYEGAGYVSSEISQLDDNHMYTYTGSDFRQTYVDSRDVGRGINSHAEIRRGHRFTGAEIKQLARSGVYIKTSELVRGLAFVAVVSGAVLGAPSNAQAATIRQDMAVGGAPIRIEGSNVKAPVDFESFETPQSGASRSVNTVR